jgi:hypothetical protein
MARVTVITKTGRALKADVEKMQNNPAKVDGDYAAYWRTFAVHGDGKSITFPILNRGYVSIRTDNIDYVLVED